MSRTRVILRNIVSNWLGYAVQAGVVFFLTPMVLRYLGEARYGIWILVTSVTGYYGLLAFGLQGAVNQYLTRYLAVGDFDKLNKVASTALFALSAVALLVCGTSQIVAFLAPHIFNIPESLEAEIYWCIVIVGFSVALQLVLFLYAAMFVATQRYDLSNAIGIMTRILSATLIVVAIRLELGLVGISIATAASNALDYLARYFVARRLVSKLEISLALVNRSSFAEISSYSRWSFMIAISQKTTMHLDAVIIGALMPIAALSPYALAAGLTRQLADLLQPISQVFFPALTELHAQNDRKMLRAVYLRGSRFLLLTAIILTVVAVVWAEDFYRLWVGQRFANAQEYPPVALLFQILAIALLGRFITGLGGQVLLGSLRVKPVAILVMLEAIFNIILSIVLARQYGLLGVASATVASIVLFRSIAIPVLTGRLLDIPLTTYANVVLLRPLAAAIVMSLTCVLVRMVGRPQSWSELIAQGLMAAAIGLPLAAIVGLTREDRTEYLYKPLQNILRRLAVSTRD